MYASLKMLDNSLRYAHSRFAFTYLGKVRVDNPLDDIEKIFDKICAWKEK